MGKSNEASGTYSPVSRSENDSEEAEFFPGRLELATRYDKIGHDKLSKFKNWVILVLTLLTATNIASLALLLRGQSGRQGEDQDGLETTRYYLTSSSGRAYPSTVTRAYYDYDDNFLDHNVTRATEYWRGLFPVGDGIVALTDEEVKQMDLIQSARAFNDASKTIYLSQVRSIIIKLHQDPTFIIADPTYYHTMHCVDVVRQQILCHADGTLIYKRPQDKYPGDGGMRTCNNFDALTHWAKDHAHPLEAKDPGIVPGHEAEHAES